MNEPTMQTNAPDPMSAQPVTAAGPIVCWVGLDWADQKHCLAVRTDPTSPAKTFYVDQKPEKFEEFFLNLRRQHPHGRIAVAIEQSRGPVLYALMKFDFLGLYPVNPRTLADYRRAFKLSGAKDDPLDADLLGELLARHADRLRPLTLEDQATRKLRLATESRRDFVDERTALSNRLGAALKCYYPLAVELWGEDLTGMLALKFLQRWPNLAQLQAATPKALRAFFYAHNSRSEKRIADRLKAIAAARPLTEDTALIEPLQLQMQRLVSQLLTVQETIAHYDQYISQIFAAHSQAWLFEPLPGAGPVLAPRLAAVFGTRLDHYPQTLDLLAFSGVAPVRKQSGNLEVIHFRYARPVFVHQTLVEFAKCSIGQCPWARLLYDHQIKKGNSKWMAIRKVAFKWIRILWRCWKERQPYDETKYLRSLQRDGVALYSTLYEALPPLQTPLVNR